MSRIGMKPISIPGGVKVSISDRTVQVTGPLGNLSFTHRPEIEAKVDGERVIVTRRADDRQSKALHGLTRSLIANMVEGVSKGFEKSMEVYGTGFSVQLQGNKLAIVCGKSHPEILEVLAGVEVDVTTPQARGDSTPAKFTIKGPDKQAVGEFAARCRQARPPEPYKGKGVRYADEHVRRKVGKAFAGSAT